MPDWYPTREEDLIAWHSAFSASVASYAATLGLAAGLVTQIATDAATVASVLNYLEQAQNFAQEVKAFKDQVLHGALNTPNPVIPTVPATLTLGLGWLGDIEARTRQTANVIKANPAYTAQMGQDMGIVSGTSTPPPLGVTATALTQSQVQVKLAKGGFSVLALDSRRGGGAWEQIALLTNATYVDGRAPLTPGQPEQREYRCQGYEDNQRTGALSDIVSVVTVP